MLVGPMTVHAAGSLGIIANVEEVKPKGIFEVTIGGDCMGFVSLKVENGTSLEESVLVEGDPVTVEIVAGETGTVEVTATPAAEFFDLDGNDFKPEPQSIIVQINELVEETKKSLAEVEFSTIDDQTYTGEEIRPEIILFTEDEKLVEGVDYDVVYENNVEPGMGSITVIGKGDYEEKSIVKTFNIVKVEPEDSEVGIGIDDMNTENDSTEACFIHWGIIGIFVLVAIILLLFRKRKKAYVIILIAVAAISVCLCLLPTCNLDWVCAIAGTIFVEILDIIFVKKYNKENETA